METRKCILIILDGWGKGQIPEVDAIFKAKTSYFDYLIANYPNATLTTHGEKVGLPAGQMGNSEVGHLNIGAGRIVYQELARINKAVEDQSLGKTKAISEAIQYAKKNHKTFHILGLCSDGGVHSHINHIKAVCDILDQEEVPKASIHAFLDGRDTDPKSGRDFIDDLTSHIENTSIELDSVIGRYYAMDRDQRWERIRRAYDLLVHGKGHQTESLSGAIESSYTDGITDEFMEPIFRSGGRTIDQGDVVFFVNFRTDRPRQITRALTQEDFPEYAMSTLDLHFVTMTRYNETFEDIHVVFSKDVLNNTLGEVISKQGLSQIRIAETEKYPHVTFFFSGGREKPFANEDRILIPSPKVATYDLKPEMSAIEVTDAICLAIQRSQPDFICLNYANTDMVGHTGVFSAAMKAAQTVDTCLHRLVNKALAFHYEVIIIADHGNSDFMVNADGSPHTAHTTNPVPVIYVSNGHKTAFIDNGILADVAPTILKLMGLKQPDTMTGRILIQSA